MYSTCTTEIDGKTVDLLYFQYVGRYIVKDTEKQGRFIASGTTLDEAIKVYKEFVRAAKEATGSTASSVQ
jgi:hypothetical protein